MALNNGRFTGEIDNKNLFSYSNKLDYTIEDLDKRKKLISEILNLDEIGSKDKFWMDIWDMANCKVSLNKTDALWTETNVAQLLESMGTYLIAKDESDEKKERRRFSRPKKETSINGDYSSEEYSIAKNDKNYRLDPPDEIKSQDYRLRTIFSKDYDYYKNVDSGLYYEIEEFSAGAVSYDYNSLMENLEDLLSGKDEHAEKRRSVRNKFMSYETGVASKKIIERVLNIKDK